MHRVGAPAALRYVLMRKQNLGDRSAVCFERLRPGSHQLDLAGGGRSLSFGHGRAATPESSPSGRNCTRCNEDGLAAFTHYIIDFGRQRFDNVLPETCGIRQHGAADFDDNTPSRIYNGGFEV
jgi:hypothetical protein